MIGYRRYCAVLCATWLILRPRGRRCQVLDRRQMSASECETCLRMRVSARGSGVAPVSITLTVGHGCAGASLPRPCRTRPLAAAAATAGVHAASAFLLLLSLAALHRIAVAHVAAANLQLPNCCTQATRVTVAAAVAAHAPFCCCSRRPRPRLPAE